MTQLILIAFMAFLSGFIIALFLQWRREKKVPKHIRDLRKAVREAKMFDDSLPNLKP